MEEIITVRSARDRLKMPLKGITVPLLGNKTPRQELDLLNKGKIVGQAELGATPTQISRNLSVPRSTIYRVLKQLHTPPSRANKPRSRRPSVLTPRDILLLVYHVRLEPKIKWAKLKSDTGLNFNSRTLERVLEANEISHWLPLKDLNSPKEIEGRSKGVQK